MRRYVVGIDLGTSNCAVAFVDPSQGANAKVHDFQVTQLVRSGEVTGRSLFPSTIYLPFDGEFPVGSTTLPWGASTPISGEFARWQGGQVPGRTISSAKSWLIHQHVDRQAAILPWGSAADVPKMSPVEAQAELLRHISASWDHQNPDAPLAKQDVVVTIPASFDEAARALTLQAARDAGFDLQHLTLIEEPQAAFYDFTSRHRSDLKSAVEGVGLVLVIDVGGGTTDFCLVQIALLPEGPALRRIAVGDHLLLGGDNMDAAIGRVLEKKILPDNRRFSASQWTQAVAAARGAKERLLAGDPPERVKVTLAASGSRLLGGTLSAELSRDEVVSTLVDGFFPPVSATDESMRAQRGAVVELGLPYAADPAITKHVLSFLRAHREIAPPLPRPDAILLNGGVFNSPVLTQALMDRLTALWPSSPQIRLIDHDSLDLAVARGAAYSGLARRALGKKIGGGTPRAFYVVVSIDGVRKGVCLIPRGLDEGETVDLTQRAFQLMLGRPVQFQLYSTTADRLDRPGDVVDIDDESFAPLPPIHTILEGAKGSTAAVHLIATITEVGTIALSCVSGPLRWRLEFELRGVSRNQSVAIVQSMPARFTDATLEIDRVFGTKPMPVDAKDVKNLFRTLEKILGPRETWALPILREMWTTLWSGVGKRRRSIDHEKIMFQLLGYTLRPGVGYPLDDWRCTQTFSIFKELVTHHAEQAIWAEFFVLFRRIAGGLTETQHDEIWRLLKPQLLRRVPVGLPTPKEKLKGIQPEGLEEMVRCAASLELLPVEEKVLLGTWIVSRIHAPATTGGPWAWALGRLGARVPIHGAAHCVVPDSIAAEWIEVLLKVDAKRHDQSLFALTQLARKTGDRSRDIDENIRVQVLAALSKSNAAASWKQMVAEVIQLSAADEARALGDSLPVGLSID